MELRHIRYFLAVAEERNFTRAAEKLGIGQPPLSQQIRSLEQELGAPLFLRVPHGAELTDSGKAFLPEARALIVQAERAVRLAKRGAQGEIGHLRLGFTSSSIFTPVVQNILRIFHEQYPQITFSLEEKNTSILLEKIAEQSIDAAFIRPGSTNPDGVKTYRLIEEKTLIALSTQHPLAKKSAIPLAALAQEPLILFHREAGPALFDETIAAFKQAGVTPIISHEAPQITTVGNLVAAGFGFSIVPASIASQIRIDGVKYLKIIGIAPTVPVALAIRENEASVIVKHLIELIDQDV